MYDFLFMNRYVCLYCVLLRGVLFCVVTCCIILCCFELISVVLCHFVICCIIVCCYMLCLFVLLYFVSCCFVWRYFLFCDMLYYLYFVLLYVVLFCYALFYVILGCVVPEILSLSIQIRIFLKTHHTSVMVSGITLYLCVSVIHRFVADRVSLQPTLLLRESTLVLCSDLMALLENN